MGSRAGANLVCRALSAAVSWLAGATGRPGGRGSFRGLHRPAAGSGATSAHSGHPSLAVPGPSGAGTGAHSAQFPHPDRGAMGRSLLDHARAAGSLAGTRDGPLRPTQVRAWASPVGQESRVSHELFNFVGVNATRVRPYYITGMSGNTGVSIVGAHPCGRPGISSLQPSPWQFIAQYLQNQHGIPKAEEAVAFAYGLLVGLFDQGFACEGAHQQQQRGARQVEVGYHGIDHLETIAGRDKQASRAVTGFDFAIMETGSALQHAHRRRAYRDHAPACPARLIDQRGGRRVQVNLFAVHLMLAEILNLDGAKGVQSHMQRHKTHAHSLPAQFIQQVRREMEPGGGRGSRATYARIDRLVAFGVLQRLMYIRWQRHTA